MQCRPSDEEGVRGCESDLVERERENAAVSAAAVKDGVRALRRKGARTKSEVGFYPFFSRFFGHKYFWSLLLVQYGYQPSKSSVSQRNSVVI